MRRARNPFIWTQILSAIDGESAQAVVLLLRRQSTLWEFIWMRRVLMKRHSIFPRRIREKRDEKKPPWAVPHLNNARVGPHVFHTFGLSDRSAAVESPSFITQVPSCTPRSPHERKIFSFTCHPLCAGDRNRFFREFCGWRCKCAAVFSWECPGKFTSMRDTSTPLLSSSLWMTIKELDSHLGCVPNSV